jgi:hypothetical protein
VGSSHFARAFRFFTAHPTKKSRDIEALAPLPRPLGSRSASFLTPLLALAVCFGLRQVALAQSTDQPVEPKLPPVRCKLAPSKDAVQWTITPKAPATPETQPTPIERATPAIPVALPQIPDQQERIEPKLPSVRCKIVPTKDAVLWEGMPTALSTPGAPTRPALEDISTKKALSQTPNSRGQLPVLNPNLPDAKRQLVRSAAADDVGTRNGERPPSTDAWFQIPTETEEPTDVQEAVLTASIDDRNKAEPRPLAQVLADLARRAQRNFVDPGIALTETITYNFTDSDLDPWEAFIRIAQTRGYRIVYRDDIVTLTRSEHDPLNPANAHTVKAEVWLWLDQPGKPTNGSGLVVQLAGANVIPSRKPQAVRSLEAGNISKISLIDVHSELGDSTLHLTVNPVLLPDGNIQADLEIENAAPSSDGHKGVTIRRSINRTVELTGTKQVIEIGGILMPNYDPIADKKSWIQRWFRKKTPETASARMIVKLTVEPAAGSETPINTDNPDRIPKSDSGKTGIALAPRQNRPTPELTLIQNLKH